MAPGQRRRDAPSPARIALLGLLNALALLALWRMVAAPGAGALAAEEVQPTSPDEVSVQRATPRREGPSALDRSALARRVRAIVDRYVAKARGLTKGRVDRGNARVSVHVRELGGRLDAELALDADRAQRPASNMKLVTSAAALVLLGADWNFETTFSAAGELRDGRLEGDLVVRAAGDPLYDPIAGGSVDGFLEPVAHALHDAGLRSVAGALVLDEGTFAAPSVPPGWPGEGQHWADYCALAGGLSANRGCLQALVTPTRPGAPARVSVEPRHHGLVKTYDVATTAGGKLIVNLDARGPAGALVRGSIPARSQPWSDAFAHPDPVELFGFSFLGALGERGIQVDGGLRREREAAPGTELARLRTPLTATLVPINTDSENGVADQVFLTLGHELQGLGTRASAARATAEALERLGVPSAEFEQVDGSGLSRDNRVTARQVSALIDAVLSMGEPAASLFRDSLAIGGETGTLSKRMGGKGLRGKVQAKTGFIDGVSALSGVARSDAGPEYVFSILVEYPPTGGLNSSCWKPMQDEICAELVGLEP